MERYRIQPPEPEAAPQPKAPAARVPVKLNKNFLNFPIARDARTRTDWWRSEKTGRWLADLPGAKGITLVLPADTSKRLRRAPTALDVNVVAQILSEAQAASKGARVEAVEFPSIAALLRHVGLTVQSANRARLRDSLRYLSRIEIEFKEWYEHGRAGRKPERVWRRLPPIVRRIEWPRNRVVVTLDAEWEAMAKAGYYAALPLPLPNSASAQNLILLLLTSLWSDLDSEKASVRPTLRAVTRKLGLNHSTRNRRFAAAKVEAETWFERNGGALDLVVTGRKLIAFATMPVVPRKRVTDADLRARKSDTDAGGRRRKSDTDAGGDLYTRVEPYDRRKEAAGAARSRYARMETGRRGRDFYPEPDEFVRLEDNGTIEDPHADYLCGGG